MKKLFPSVLIVCVLLLGSACKRAPQKPIDTAYVSAPLVNLRDRMASVYNKTGSVKNGEKLDVLEKSKDGRFLRVRSSRGEEGWVAQRYTINDAVFRGFEKLAADSAAAPVQARAFARRDANLHLDPGRDTEHLYQLKEKDRVDLLRRSTSVRPATTMSPAKPATGTPDGNTPPPAPVLEDWWLVRDSAGHAGWLFGRMLDFDVPLEVAQYAEGQRIVASFVLDTVRDGDKDVPQYLLLLTEPKDGLDFDFNQARVFTWNPKKQHYETAWRERFFGLLPARVITETFGKEGKLPVFVLRGKDQKTGAISDRRYRMKGVMVRRVRENEPEKPPTKHAANKAKAG